MQELRILDVAVKRETNFVFVCSSKIRLRLPFPDRLFKHAVSSLAGTLYKTAPRASLRYPTIPRRLFSDDVVRRDSNRKTPWATDLQLSRILPHEDRSRKPIVAMGDDIQVASRTTVSLKTAMSRMKRPSW